jgi:hypothetical protein
MGQMRVNPGQPKKNDFFAVKDLKKLAFLLRVLAIKTNKNKY